MKNGEFKGDDKGVIKAVLIIIGKMTVLFRFGDYVIIEY